MTHELLGYALGWSATVGCFLSCHSRLARFQACTVFICMPAVISNPSFSAHGQRATVTFTLHVLHSVVLHVLLSHRLILSCLDLLFV